MGISRRSPFCGIAAEFNLLEMVGPSVTPEQGVTRYEHDYTQKPACAIAAGAATIYRNYCAQVGGSRGQTADRQLDGLADLGKALADGIARPVKALWNMQNGYVMCTEDGLDAIRDHLRSLAPRETDRLRGLLRVGLHWNVDVTDVAGEKRPVVSQAFCSALPISYNKLLPASRWEPYS